MAASPYAKGVAHSDLKEGKIIMAETGEMVIVMFLNFKSAIRLEDHDENMK